MRQCLGGKLGWLLQPLAFLAQLAGLASGVSELIHKKGFITETELLPFGIPWNQSVIGQEWL